MMPVAEEMAVTLSVWVSLAAPVPMPVSGTLKEVGPSLRETLAGWSKVGGSLTALTVRRNELEDTPTPLLAKMVIMEVPDKLAAGDTVIVRLVPNPLKTRAETGTKGA